MDSKMRAQRLAYMRGADDEDVADFDAVFMAAIDDIAPAAAAYCQQADGEEDGDNDHEAGDDFRAGEVEGAGEHQSGDERGLQVQALFVQSAAAGKGAIEAIGAADDDQQAGKPCDRDGGGFAGQERC